MQIVLQAESKYTRKSKENRFLAVTGIGSIPLANTFHTKRRKSKRGKAGHCTG
jgi:hypothetical protein